MSEAETIVNTYSFEVETKEDLKELSTNEIAKSLIYYHKTSPEIAILMAHFVNYTSKPDLGYLISDFLLNQKAINNFYKIPDEMVIEIKKIVDINGFTMYNNNVKYLSE